MANKHQFGKLMAGKSNRKLITAVLLMIMSAPLAADLIMAGKNGGEVKSDLLDTANLESKTPERTAAIKDRARFRKQTREFWQAMKDYQHRTNAGEKGLTPPDINDYQSILFYTKGEESKAGEEADLKSSAPQASSLTTDDLGEKERHLLRRYQKANSCPDTLKSYGLEGFYELCLTVTKNPTGEARQGLLNPQQWISEQKDIKPATLKLRLEMLDQALDRSNRRESTKPGRPTPYINDSEQ